MSAGWQSSAKIFWHFLFFDSLSQIFDWRISSMHRGLFKFSVSICVVALFSKEAEKLWSPNLHALGANFWEFAFQKPVFAVQPLGLAFFSLRMNCFVPEISLGNSFLRRKKDVRSAVQINPPSHPASVHILEYSDRLFSSCLIKSDSLSVSLIFLMLMQKVRIGNRVY